MDYFARSIAAVMRDAGVEQAVLAGHSMGTPVARQFYRLYRNKTLGLVIVDGPLRAYGSRAEAEEFNALLRENYRETAAQFIE